MSEVTREEFDALVARVDALSAPVPEQPRSNYVHGIRDLSGNTMGLEAYDNLSEFEKARLAKASFGPLFCWGKALEVFGIDPNSTQGFLIRRSAAIAGTEFNQGRWTYADTTSDEKMPGVTAIRADEDPAAVIAELLSRPDGGDPNDKGFISGG